MVLTGLNVIKGTSTNNVCHLAIAPFHNPGNSWTLIFEPWYDFSEIKPDSKSIKS